MATKKQRRVKHLNEVPAKVHLRSGKLKIIVEIPWDDLERRLKTPLKSKAKRFRKKRKSNPAAAPQSLS
jgi:hypothetical protein